MREAIRGNQRQSEAIRLLVLTYLVGSQLVHVIAKDVRDLMIAQVKRAVTADATAP